MTKRIAIYANVPDDTDPSEVLDDMNFFFGANYSIEYDDKYGDMNEVCVEDPYTGDN